MRAATRILRDEFVRLLSLVDAGWDEIAAGGDADAIRLQIAQLEIELEEVSDALARIDVTWGVDDVMVDDNLKREPPK